MATLAGVMANGVGEVGYEAKGLEERAAEHTPAGVAATHASTQRAQLVHLAVRASEAADTGRRGSSYIAFPSHQPLYLRTPKSTVYIVTPLTFLYSPVLVPIPISLKSSLRMLCLCPSLCIQAFILFCGSP
jgi:hypothetical protein